MLMVEVVPKSVVDTSTNIFLWERDVVNMAPLKKEELKRTGASLILFCINVMMVNLVIVIQNIKKNT